MSEKVYTQEDVNRLISDAVKEHKLQREQQEREQQALAPKGINYKAEVERLQAEIALKNVKNELRGAGYSDAQAERYSTFVIDGRTTVAELVVDIPPVIKPVGIDTGGKQGKYGKWNPFK